MIREPRTIIRDILDTTDLVRPWEIAEIAFKEMSPEERDYALRTIMPGFVGDVIRNHRKRPVTGVGDGHSGRTPLRPARTHADSMRAGWARELFARFYDPTARNGKGDWFLLGDLTAAQHRAIRAARITSSEHLHAWAGWHKLCSFALETQRIQRTADLPADTLAWLLNARPNGTTHNNEAGS